MQLKFIIAALAICIAPSAYAQAKPIYFVVDASGSMQGQNRDDAELLLRALSLPRDQFVSVTYFGRKPITPGANLCFEDLEVPQPTLRGNDFQPKLEGLGGKDDQTAITNAIDKVLEKIQGAAKLIVITDGQEGCNKHFEEILARHRDAEVEIEVQQVGNSPSAELQQLEKGPSAELAVLPPTPLVNLELHAGALPEARNAWEAAGWGERFLWLLPYALLASSGWFFGSSYGKKAQFYEDEIVHLQNTRRDAAEHFARTNTRSTLPWPLFKSPPQATTDDVRRSRKASFASLLLACAAGIPLIVLSGASSEFNFVTKLATPVLILALIFVGPHVGKSKPARALFPTSLKFGLALSACVIAVSSIYFFIDDEDARGAAWTVLSSGFSAALAIVASAPLIFAGTQLGKLDRVQASYKNTWDHGIDETHRVDLAEARKQKEERDRFLSAVAGWIFPTHTSLYSRLPNLALNRNKKAVKAYLESLARKAATTVKQDGGGSELSSLSQSGDLVRFIRAIIKVPEMNLSEQIVDALTQIADAYESEIPGKLTKAFSDAARILPGPEA